MLSHFYYFIIILKSPPRLCEAKNLAVQLFIDCGCCLFEFCRETSPFSLVCGVMLLPHFSQSVTKPGHPWWEPWWAPRAQVIPPWKKSHSARLSGELPLGPRHALVSRKYRHFCYLTFAWWAPHGPKYSSAGPVPWQVQSPCLPDVLVLEWDQLQSGKSVSSHVDITWGRSGLVYSQHRLHIFRGRKVNPKSGCASQINKFNCGL